jgi:hypothetical protein
MYPADTLPKEKAAFYEMTLALNNARGELERQLNSAQPDSGAQLDFARISANLPVGVSDRAFWITRGGSLVGVDYRSGALVELYPYKDGSKWATACNGRPAAAVPKSCGDKVQ